VNVTLNSRTLVGPQHTAAEIFLRDYYPLGLSKVDWVESPSARCVLGLQQAASAASATGDASVAGSALPESEVLRTLEQKLRAHVGLKPYHGDDSSQSEGHGFLS
jgi:hypothetical protein